MECLRVYRSGCPDEAIASCPRAEVCVTNVMFTTSRARTTRGSSAPTFHSDEPPREGAHDEAHRCHARSCRRDGRLRFGRRGIYGSVGGSAGRQVGGRQAATGSSHPVQQSIGPDDVQTRRPGVVDGVATAGSRSPAAQRRRGAVRLLSRVSRCQFGLCGGELAAMRPSGVSLETTKPPLSGGF